MKQPQNIIFWGAGATAELGIRTTDKQTHFIRCITDDVKPLQQRISDALQENDVEPWHSVLCDLIKILGDTDRSYDSIHHIDENEREAMKRNWKGDELDARIIGLRLIYDWPALKSVVKVCPGNVNDTLKLNDLFNLLDMHIPPGSGFRAPIRQSSEHAKNQSEQQFFDARRLIGAKNALLMILIALFYIDYQECIRTKPDRLNKYRDFALMLAYRMRQQGLDIAQPGKLDQPEFYMGDVAFVSLNYDPILLWLQFNANKELNERAPKVGSSIVPLHLFHDFGHLIPARRIAKGESDWPWYPMNEAVAQRLNEQHETDFSRVRLTKFLFPHGCLCWRECPDCGKLSAYHGDDWGLHSHGLFPPPPLLSFDREEVPIWINGEERKQRERGKVDARQCLHCSTLTYAHHTQAIMQSSFKPRTPSFIEEIDRDLRALTMQANHIIFMGYSLPADDVTYRAFLASRTQRGGRNGDQRVRCTVVDWAPKYPDWYEPTELHRIVGDLPQDRGVISAREIFGVDNVRFYGGGVPNVFLESGQVSEKALQKLLTWS